MRCPLGCAQWSAPPRPRRWRQTIWMLRARAMDGAATEMHQPTPSMYRNRHDMGFANHIAGVWVGCLQERAMGCVNSFVSINSAAYSAPHRLHHIGCTARIATHGLHHIDSQTSS
eukprot:8036056-Pyramimonas_sp.AAC.1